MTIKAPITHRAATLMGDKRPRTITDVALRLKVSEVEATAAMKYLGKLKIVVKARTNDNGATAYIAAEKYASEGKGPKTQDELAEEMKQMAKNEGNAPIVCLRRNMLANDAADEEVLELIRAHQPVYGRQIKDIMETTDEKFRAAIYRLTKNGLIQKIKGFRYCRYVVTG